MFGNFLPNIASSISGFVGNLFGGNNNQQNTSSNSSSTSRNNSIVNAPRNYSNLASTLANLPTPSDIAELERLKSGGSGVVAPPPINTAQIQAQARKQAQKSVNPYYNRLLSQFKKNQARKKTEAVEDRNTTLTRIDEALQRALELSDIGRERTNEDVTANLQEIAAQEDFNQTTEGTQFDRARRALAGDTAQAGLTTSGLGRQAESEAISDRNVLSREEARRVNVQEQAQETFRTRTFQDLEQADKESERTAGEKKKDTKIDFDRYIKDLAYSTKTGIQDLEKQRKAETAAQTRDIARQKTLKWIENINDPLVRNAAYNAYGGLF